MLEEEGRFGVLSVKAERGVTALGPGVTLTAPMEMLRVTPFSSFLWGPQVSGTDGGQLEDRCQGRGSTSYCVLLKWRGVIREARKFTEAHTPKLLRTSKS